MGSSEARSVAPLLPNRIQGPAEKGMTMQLRESRAARAIAHPVRARVLERLALAPGSPSEVARGLSEPLPIVSYHVRVLNDLGFLELLGTIPRRGAIEHRYRATARVRMSIEPVDRADSGSP